MAAPDLYTYLDYRAYLRDWFEARKQVNPRFSYRAFARKAGLSSPSLLIAIVARQRNLTATTCAAFVKAMGLGADDANFFGSLVNLDQCETPAERAAAWEKVRATKRFREARQLEGAAFDAIARWSFAVVRELAACPGFIADPAWIARTVRPAISEAEATDALEGLLSVGLLKSEDGKITPTDATLVTPHEVRGLAGRSYHLGMIERARASLDSTPQAERHFCAVTVAIPASLMPTLKRELDRFQERLLDLCDGADAPRSRVVQVNLQLFPLSATITKEGR